MNTAQDDKATLQSYHTTRVASMGLYSSGQPHCIYYLMSNAVGLWNGHLDIVESKGNGDILHDVTGVDHICRGVITRIPYG